MSKIIVVMTYFNRQDQLDVTLKSMNDSAHNNFEVIIVDDCSIEPLIIPKIKYPVKIIRTENKTWFDRDIPANMGFLQALKDGADIIISQNAECYHVGDVLNYSENITEENYISFPCFSIDQENTFKIHDINSLINNKTASYLGEMSWYNHREFRPTGYDFCAVITRKNMIKLNGFDERFAGGIAYNDNYFVHRINKLGLRIDIPDSPMVVHQWHYSIYKEVPADAYLRNSNLFAQLSQTDEYKAVHTITTDFK